METLNDLMILLDAYEERGLLDTEDLRHWVEAARPPDVAAAGNSFIQGLLGAGCGPVGFHDGNGAGGGLVLHYGGGGRLFPNAEQQRLPEVLWKH